MTIFTKNCEDWNPEQFLQKRQGNSGRVRKWKFLFSNFPTDNYGTSPGDDDEASYDSDVEWCSLGPIVPKKSTHERVSARYFYSVLM